LNLASAYKLGYKIIEPHLEKYAAPRILEVGAGYGFALCYLRKRGLDVEGVEPGNSPGFEGRYENAIELLEANDLPEARQILHSAFGEALPFEDETFDIVFSADVLEHVRDIEKCLTEAIRVVKPGGVVVMVVPTYNSFREGHYNIFWLPHLLKSKRIAKWYVRAVFRRADWFIDELNFTTPRYFKKLTDRTTQLKEMKLYLVADPVFQRSFGRIVDSYYHVKEKMPVGARRLQHKLLLRFGNLALNVGEFLGMGLLCRLVWEVPEKRLHED
jgi:SAM-dependent methyltransferase